MRDVVLWFDGSCECNPGGPGGWGWSLTTEDGKPICFDMDREPAKSSVTNNTMEWSGLLAGLRHIADRPGEYGSVKVHGDSRMVVEQAAGRWKVKAENLKRFSEECKKLVREIGKHRLSFEWVPRERNAVCDVLSKGDELPAKYVGVRANRIAKQPASPAPPPVRSGLVAVSFVRCFDCRA